MFGTVKQKPECPNGEHNRVVLDRFAQLRGVARLVPGDCVCLDCGHALPATWNNGKPKWLEPVKVFLLIALISSTVQAATIHHDGVGSTTVVSLTDPGEGWVKILLGGQLPITPPDRVCVQPQLSEDKVFAEQLVDLNDRDVFWVKASALTRFTIASETTHYIQFHIGTLNGSNPPNDFQLASTWELVGGSDVVENGLTYQEWTYIVDGGEPYQVLVRTAPEPTGWIITIVLILFTALWIRKTRGTY